MPSISHYCPITNLLFQNLNKQIRKSYFIIKPNEPNHHLLLKQVGIYARKSLIALAMCIATCALPLLLVADVSVNGMRKMGVQFTHPYFNDFHYLFESAVFTAYYDQLHQFVENYLSVNEDLTTELKQSTDFNARTKQLIGLILNPFTLESEEAKRQFHQQMLEELRVLVKQKRNADQKDSAASAFIEALCEWIFTGPKLIKEMAHFIENELSDADLEALENADPKDIPRMISQFHNDLGNLSKFNGIEESNRLYDPLLLGDVPSRLYKYPIDDQQGAADVQIIRTPVITKDKQRGGRGNLKAVEIAEEFLGFLDSYQKHSKTHVYVNLMTRGGSEGIRTKAIESLEQTYSGTLHVMTLDKNSHFYWQTHAFSNLHDADHFKAEFLSKMFDHKSTAYYWPSALGIDWKDDCQEIIERVHQHYFSGKGDLSQQERKDFIELTYTEMIEAAFKKLKPNSANLSCKSCIDRGASALGEQYTKRCQSQKQEWTKSRRQRLMTIALAPAILAMNRVMQADRMPRMQSAAQYILLNS